MIDAAPPERVFDLLLLAIKMWLRWSLKSWLTNGCGRILRIKLAAQTLQLDACNFLLIADTAPTERVSICCFFAIKMWLLRSLFCSLVKPLMRLLKNLHAISVKIFPYSFFSLRYSLLTFPYSFLASRVKPMVVPTSGRLRTCMFWPWASIICLQMARPRPVPPLSRLRALSVR